MTSINSGRMKKGILAAFVAALALTAEIYAQTNDTGNMETKERIYGSVFPRGEKLPEMFAKYFTGQAYLARLTRDEALNCPVSNVTFEPGCRNNWHSHTGGQLLVAVSGRGYYQAKGEPARELLPGDVVEIGPRQLVFAPGRRDQPADEPQYVAGAGRRRAVCRGDRPCGCRRSAAGRRGAPQPCGTFLGRCLGTGGDGSRINRNF